MPQSNLNRGLALLSNVTSYPSIPRSLINYTERCIKKGITNRFTEAIIENPELAIRAIDGMFEKACSATGLSPDELFNATDFNYKDLDPTRITSAFAEIRSINFLKQEGFVSIRPIKASSEKSSDIVADREGLNYAVEVANSIYNARGRFSPQQLKDWLINRLIGEGKSAQLDATASDLTHARRVFICVIDTAATVALQTNEEFLEAAKEAWLEAGKDPLLHVCIVTGRKALGYGRDDCVISRSPKYKWQTISS